MTGTRPGDTIDLRAANGSTVTLTIGGVHPYEQLGWAELVFTTEVADRLGATSDTRVVMWGFDDRAALDAALADVGVLGRRDTRVGHSWDPPNPDDTISTARTKVALGEPWYRINSDDSISMHPDWKAANLTDGQGAARPVRADSGAVPRRRRRRSVGGVGRRRCGRAGRRDRGRQRQRIRRLFQPSVQPSLSGFLSRHTYGMALDTNTVSNCGGCRPPRMNCDVVRIFRTPRVRVGRQLPSARRDALRVGRRAPRPDRRTRRRTAPTSSIRRSSRPRPFRSVSVC